MEEETKVMWLIIEKLARMNRWGGSHTEITNLTKGLPLHYIRSNKGKRTIQKAIKELIIANLLNNKTFLAAL
mgnify:CR=1 FL=1